MINTKFKFVAVVGLGMFAAHKVKVRGMIF